MIQGGKRFVKEMKREFISKGAKKSASSIDRNKNNIKEEINKIKEL